MIAAGTMKQQPATIRPRHPRLRKPMWMAISVELGPGIKLAAASRSRNSSRVSHALRATNSCSIIAMCAAGPPNAIVPSFRKTSASSTNPTFGVSAAGVACSVSGGIMDGDHDSAACSRFSVSQINICFVEPVLARRIEHVQINGVFHRFRFMRHVGRNTQHLSGANNDFLAVNPELQRAFKNVSELLVDVAMLAYHKAI